MSRRRFFTPQSTYNAFISSSEYHQQSNVLPISQLAQNITANTTSNTMGININDANNTSSVSDMTSIQIPADTTSSTPLYLNRRNLDEVVRRKSLLLFLNGILGIVLMIVEQQLCWTGTKCTDNQHTIIIKFIITWFSILLVYQILDRKRIQIAIKYREKRRKNRHRTTAAQQSTAHLLNLTQPYNVPLNQCASDVEAIVNDTPQYNIITLLSLQPSQFRWKLWVQCIVAIIHPVPYMSQYTGIGDEVGLLMFLRLQLIFRVIRDYSEIWLNRRSIKKLRAFQSRTPDFNWWLSFKTVCFRSPIQFALTFAVCAVLIYGYCIYILERTAQPTQMWFLRGVWLAFQAITILWTSDVYNQFNPITWPGRLMCSLSAVNGLLLSSFIIGTVSQQLQPSRFEESALNWVVVDKIRSRERDVAARLIQFVWRNYLHEHELQYKLKHKNLRLYEEITDREEKEFMEEFLARSKLLRNIRRDRAELEDQLDPTHNINSHSIQHEVYMDERIELMRNDIVSVISTHDDTLHRIESMLSSLMHANQLSMKMSNEAIDSASDSSDDNQPQSVNRLSSQSQYNEFDDYQSIQQRQQRGAFNGMSSYSTPLRPQTSPERHIDSAILPSTLFINQQQQSRTPRNIQRQRRTSTLSRNVSSRSNDMSAQTKPGRRKNIWDYADSSLDEDSDLDERELSLSSTATVPVQNDQRIRSLLQRVHLRRLRSDSVDSTQQQRSIGLLNQLPSSPSNVRAPLNRLFHEQNQSLNTNMATVSEQSDESNEQSTIQQNQQQPQDNTNK